MTSRPDRAGREGTAGKRSHRASIAMALTAAALLQGGPVAADPPQGAYPLDAIERHVHPGAALPCPKEQDRVTYRGKLMRYRPQANVVPAFRDKLERFEVVVAEAAREVYGRAPIAIVDLGTYNCRRIAAYPDWLSEHALGNAIDIAGFDFGPLPRGEALPASVPAAFRTGFEVRVLSHWNATTGHAAVHARFLKSLARRLIAHDEIFRVVLGPGYPGHDNHFHLDAAPYRLVEVFERDAKGKKVALVPDPGG